MRCKACRKAKTYCRHHIREELGIGKRIIQAVDQISNEERHEPRADTLRTFERVYRDAVARARSREALRREVAPDDRRGTPHEHGQHYRTAERLGLLLSAVQQDT